MRCVMKKYAIKLTPYISETIWGGRKLIDEYNIVTDKSNAAEGWMLSCLENGPSVVANGEYAGKTLPEVLESEKSWCGKNAERFSEFPILIKFIDAMDDLSVQVHPTKDYCEKTGRGRSKTECWYIIDCEKDAHLLLGFKDKITPEQFRSAVESGTLTDYVEKVPVKPGDFFFIDAGTLHAICKGVLLAEVQESSDTTYRIFDYNRVGKDGKPRELHVADAMEVTKLEKYVQSAPAASGGSRKKLLTKCDLFTVYKLDLFGLRQDTADESSFVSLLVMSGHGELTACGETLKIRKGDSIFIPAGSGSYTLKGSFEILETRI